MEVDEKISPKKYLLMVLFSFILFIIFLGEMLDLFYKAKDFVRVDANVVGLEYRSDDTQDGGTTNYQNLILTYNYDNKEYSGEYRIFSKSSKKRKDSIKIYINPNDPSEIRNDYMISLTAILSVFGILAHIFCIKAYLVRRKM